MTPSERAVRDAVVIDEFIEKGADIEHTRWAKWQEYFFSKCQVKPQHQLGGMDDRYTYFALPTDLYNRWKRQIVTLYADLSEEEKESDRKEVRSYLPLITTLIKQERERITTEMHEFFPVPDMEMAEMWPHDEQVRWAAIGEVIVALEAVLGVSEV